MNGICESRIELLMIDASQLLQSIRQEFDYSATYFSEHPDEASNWHSEIFPIVGAAVNAAADIVGLISELADNGNIKIEVIDLP